MAESHASRSHRFRALAVDPLAVAGAVKHQEQGDWSGQEQIPGIKASLLKVIDDLGSHPEMVVEHLEIGAYGCGYASFFAVFVTHRDPEFRARALKRSGYSDCVAGLDILLCLLAPLAVISNPSHVGPRSGTLTFQGEYLTDEHVEWLALGEMVTAVLVRNGIEALPAHILDQQIDPELYIDTNMGDKPFTVFDAWFHWAD